MSWPGKAPARLYPNISNLPYGGGVALLVLIIISVLPNAAGQTSGGNVPSNAISNAPQTPVPGDGHDYIRLLSESVNPSNGSVSLDIRPPMPTGRGITPSFSFSYNSGALSSLNDFLGSLVWDSINGGNYSAASGWQNSGFPYVTGQIWQIVVPLPPQAGRGNIICDFASGYTFTDSSGRSHALNVAAQVTDPNSKAAGLRQRCN